MAESTVVKNFRDGTILLEDGTGTPLAYTVTYEQGNFTFANSEAARVTVRDRGVIAGLRKGDDQVKSFSFSVHFREFKNASGDGTLIDFIKQTNAFSAFVSTAGAAYEQKLSKCTFTVEGTDFSDGADHVLILNDCFLDYDMAEGETNVINVTGEVYGATSRTGPS